MEIIETGPVGQTVSGEYQVDTRRGTMRDDLHKQWAARPMDERFLSLDDLRGKVRARYDNSEAQTIQNREIEVLSPSIETIEDTHTISVGLPGGKEASFTNWAFGQTCGLAKAPAAYMRTLPSNLVADNLNYSLRYNREVEEIKTYHGDQGTGRELYALTGPKYGRIPDYEMVQAVQQVAGDGRGSHHWKVPGCLNWATGTYDPYAEVTLESTTLYASDRDVWFFLVDDTRPIEIGKLADGSPDLVFRGFFGWNSEVGKSSMGLATFLMRGVCMNRCMWGVEDFAELRIRHSSGAPSRFMMEAAPALRSYAEGSTAGILEGIERARAAKVATDEEEALAFLKARDFTAKQSRRVLEIHEAEEGRPARSRWDMAQGITAMARSVAHQDERVAIERKAGKLLAVA